MDRDYQTAREMELNRNEVKWQESVERTAAALRKARQEGREQEEIRHSDYPGAKVVAKWRPRGEEGTVYLHTSEVKDAIDVRCECRKTYFIDSYRACSNPKCDAAKKKGRAKDKDFYLGEGRPLPYGYDLFVDLFKDVHPGHFQGAGRGSVAVVGTFGHGDKSVIHRDFYAGEPCPQGDGDCR